MGGGSLLVWPGDDVLVAVSPGSSAGDQPADVAIEEVAPRGGKRTLWPNERASARTIGQPSHTVSPQGDAISSVTTSNSSPQVPQHDNMDYLVAASFPVIRTALDSSPRSQPLGMSL